MPERVLTVLGSTVLSLMAEKGIARQTEMVRLLQKEGFAISQNAFSNWLYGASAASKDFPPAFARALNLNEQEKDRLARAFTFGQNQRTTIEDW